MYSVLNINEGEIMRHLTQFLCYSAAYFSLTFQIILLKKGHYSNPQSLTNFLSQQRHSPQTGKVYYSIIISAIRRHSIVP